MPVDEIPDTQDVDVEASGSPDDQGTPDSASDDEYFLDVDERHRYRTADDVKKAITESGSRIAQLSQWEKELEAFGPLTPAQVRDFLVELAERRQTEIGAKSSQGKPAGDSKTSVPDESGLDPEDRKAREYLKKVLPDLGYVPKSELESLQEQVKQLQSMNEGQQAEYRDSLIESGRAQLDTLLSENGLPTDNPKFKRGVEGMIRDWINEDDARVRRFYMGGSITQNLIKEGFDQAMEVLGVVRGQSASVYVKDKKAAVARNPKPLPKPGLPGKPAKPSPGLGFGSGDLHKRAFEAAQRVWGGGNEE